MIIKFCFRTAGHLPLSVFSSSRYKVTVTPYCKLSLILYEVESFSVPDLNVSEITFDRKGRCVVCGYASSGWHERLPCRRRPGQCKMRRPATSEKRSKSWQVASCFVGIACNVIRSGLDVSRAGRSPDAHASAACAFINTCPRHPAPFSL